MRMSSEVSALEGVFAVAADFDVSALVADERIVTVAAKENVRAAVADEAIVAGAADEIAGAGDVVVDDLIVAAKAVGDEAAGRLEIAEIAIVVFDANALFCRR